MKSKIISRTLISTFSFPLLSISVSNKACRRCIILKAFGITALFLLMLVDVAGASSFAYITNYDNNNVSVINTSSSTVVASVNVGSGPKGVAVSPDGTRAYVANSCSNNVYVIDTTKNKVIDITHVGSYPQGIAVSPDGKKVYVGNAASGTISVIDTPTNNVTAGVPVGSLPQGIAVSPDGTRVYVAIQNPGGYSGTGDIDVTSQTGAVDVIDTTKNEVIDTVSVGSLPLEVTVTPDGNQVYVVNEENNTVSVIDTATNKVNTTVHVGRGPVAVGIGSVTKSSSTIESIGNSFLNPVNQTDNQTNDTWMTATEGTAGEQEKNQYLLKHQKILLF